MQCGISEKNNRSTNLLSAITRI